MQNARLFAAKRKPKCYKMQKSKQHITDDGRKINPKKSKKADAFKVKETKKRCILAILTCILVAANFEFSTK